MEATISTKTQSNRKKIIYHAEFWEDEIVGVKESHILHEKNIAGQKEKQKLSVILARMTAMVLLMEKAYDE